MIFSPVSEVQFRRIIIAAVVLLGIVAYANSFHNEFVWDDASSVQINKHIQDPSFFLQLFREQQHAFKMQQGGNFYRPLVAASFMFDYQVAGGKQPGNQVMPDIPVWPFHATNLALHILTALLLFALMSRLGAPRLVRALAPMLYVVHPLHTEAVTYISGRADMMSATFMFAGLLFALRERNLRQRTVGTVLMAVCFVCALLSKESGFIFPFLLALIIAFTPVEGQDSRKKAYLQRLVPLVVSIVLLSVYVALRMSVLKFDASYTAKSGLGARLIEMVQALATYFRLIFVPTGLHMERTLAGATGVTAAVGVIILLLIAGALVFCLKYRRPDFEPRRRIALGLAWFLVTWLPISGIFPLNAPLAEHWLYVPLAGLLWAMVETIVFIASSSRGRAVVAVAGYAACLSFMVLTVDRNRDWRDNETLYLATLKQNPNTARVHQNLAITYEDILGNAAGARRHYEQVLALNKEKKKAKAPSGGELPVWVEELDVHRALGTLYYRDAQYQKAIDHFQVLANTKPTNEMQQAFVLEGALGYAKCLLAMGDRANAIQVLDKVVSTQPGVQSEVSKILNGAL